MYKKITKKRARALYNTGAAIYLVRNKTSIYSEMFRIEISKHSDDSFETALKYYEYYSDPSLGNYTLYYIKEKNNGSKI